ncbi:hypothetical protein [Streptomyces sp. NPDC086787]|uniref:hypothetical protein n=1 Tax=Streptomyces sp. NPDC086787 TaxID=3365759 RepID=UPI0037F4555B
MSSTRHPGRGRTWPRVLALLLVLLVPGARAETHLVPVVASAADAVDADIDILDTALRPSYRTAPRPAPPARASGRPGRAPITPVGGRTPTAGPSPLHASRILRSVVLRC